ncbi:MAG TPA: TIGR02996 domain-containing protein [Kofleriaceae bacterium]
MSKAMFEKAARGLELGDIWETDEYASRHKSLDVLADGGDMFLVTVRPPETLWLVATLRDPRATDRGWTANQPNAAPIRDIDALRNQLRFVTGAGITARAGALGMSLQTPRVLTDGDVALLSGATSAKSTPAVAGATSAKSKPAVAATTSAKSKPAVAGATSAKSTPAVAAATSAKSTPTTSAKSNAAASIADAGAHASRGEWPQALAALLADWQRAPRRAVADAIAAIDATLPAREVASAKWLAVAKAHDPDALRGLLATIFDAGSKPARERAEALCEWPLDPRVDRWMAGLYDMPVYSSTGARPLWTRLQPLTKRIVDARAIDTIDKARKGNWKQCDFETDFLAEYIDRAKLIKRPEKPLSADESRELATIAKQLGEATAKPASGLQADELLAQVLANPSDDGARAVLADALNELGDPRGELIALQLAPPTPENTRRANAIIKQHRDALLGPLADIVMDAELERGFLSRARLKHASGPLVANAIAASVGDPLWATVEHLEGPGDDRVALHPVMRSLRSLANTSLEVAELADKLPRLERLCAIEVNATELDVLVGKSLPKLRELDVAIATGATAASAARKLMSSRAQLAKLGLGLPMPHSYPAEARTSQWQTIRPLFEVAARSAIPEITIRLIHNRQREWACYARLLKRGRALDVRVGMAFPNRNWETLGEVDMRDLVDAIDELHPASIELEKPPRDPKIRAAVEQLLSSRRTP